MATTPALNTGTTATTAASWHPWLQWLCLSWFWVSNIVCVVWVWVSNVVCVLWTMVTTLVCVVWDIAVTILSAILEVLDSVFGWILSFVAAIVELVFALPFLGRLLHWLWNAVVLNLIWLVVNLIDAALYFVGVRPQKKLRVCTIVLRDENGTPVIPANNIGDVVNALNDAIDIFLRECNVQILNSVPFQFSSGLSFDANRADASWVKIDGRPSQTDLLDGRCDAAGLGNDLQTVGARFQTKGLTSCFFGNWRRVVGLGSPIVVFVVRTIDTTTPQPLAGCGLWFPNYLTITPAAVTGRRPLMTLAHELGHMCNLWHVCDPPNLMCVIDTTCNTCTRGSLLRFWQEILVRASRHVRYL